MSALTPLVSARGVSRSYTVRRGLFGAAALTRELALGIAVLSGLWWVSRASPTERRPAALRACVLLVIALAVTAPWVVRNMQVFDRYIGVSTVGWFAIAEGNSLESCK